MNVAVIFRKSDILIGALDNHLSMSEEFVASFPYHSDDLIWCIQKSQPVPMWINAFELCDEPVVYLLVVVFGTSCVFFIYFTQQFDGVSLKWSWVRTSCAIIRCYCGQVIEYKPKLHSTRIFFTACLFSALLFDILFMTLWTKNMTTPVFKHQVQSVQEIIDNRFKLAGDGFALHQLKQNEVIDIESVSKTDGFIFRKFHNLNLI